MHTTLLHTAAIARLEDLQRVSGARRRDTLLRAPRTVTGLRRRFGGGGRRPHGILRPAL